MSQQKISVNADRVLQTISQYPRPASLKQIADASGNAGVQSLEKHQVRHAVNEHLLETGLVEEYSREVNGNEVAHYTLTESGQARFSIGNERVEELELAVEDLSEQVSEHEEKLEEVKEYINQTLPEKMREITERVETNNDGAKLAHTRIERLVELLDGEVEGRNVEMAVLTSNGRQDD
ncbi:hypothetical protein N0B31_18680 [Salinirubellus salinus]|uniref:Uncharacterized protein n=1 Tax=Salinirubellus salinus TaxID=1364945 RepID=A0A9E7R2M6_9EURY|nr:hypothetical protein [Salinirubellus salinus]UWM54129.1 hypothetical protein N0B31_18680 [Salinirubellus salinus]